MSNSSFDQAIAHTPLGDGKFRTLTPPEWQASTRSPGGLVGAQLFAGLQAIVPDSNFRPRSFTIHLLRAPQQQEYEVQAEILRVGRTYANLIGRVTQGEKLIATALAGFGTDRLSPDLDEIPMPIVEPPSKGLENSSYIPEFAYPFGNNILIQDRLGPKPFSAPDGPMERIGWAGFADERPIDAPGLIMIGDIGMMGWWVRLDRMHTTATLDHTTHFRADLDSEIPGGMVLVRSRTGLVRNGYLDWDADIWSQDGTLLCQSRQLLAILD